MLLLHIHRESISVQLGFSTSEPTMWHCLFRASLHLVVTLPRPLISQAAQQTEVYWMALARDIPFSEYATNDIIRLAAGKSR